MAARQAMIDRAVIETDTNTTAGPDGLPGIPSWSESSKKIACRYYTQVKRQVIDGNKLALVEDLRLLLPKGTAIAEAQRIARIENRLGVTIAAGPFGIETIQERRTYLEAQLVRVS